MDSQRVRVSRQERKKRFGSEKCIMHETLIRHAAATGSSTAIVQGDTFGCSQGLVDDKTEVVFPYMDLILKCNL